MKKLFDVLEATSSAKDLSTSLSAIYALRNVKMDVRLRSFFLFLSFVISFGPSHLLALCADLDQRKDRRVGGLHQASARGVLRPQGQEAQGGTPSRLRRAFGTPTPPAHGPS
jgi:hypothetical protein